MYYWRQDLPFPNSLPSELRRWQALWQYKHNQTKGQLSGDEVPSNLLSSLSFCGKEVFPNLHCLLVIANTLPITSAEAERSLFFSDEKTQNLISIYSLTEEHFSDYSVIAMNYSERIEQDEIIHTFIQSHPRRIFVSSVLSEQ